MDEDLTWRDIMHRMWGGFVGDRVVDSLLKSHFVARADLERVDRKRHVLGRQLARLTDQLRQRGARFFQYLADKRIGVTGREIDTLEFRLHRPENIMSIPIIK